MVTRRVSPLILGSRPVSVERRRIPDASGPPTTQPTRRRTLWNVFAFELEPPGYVELVFPIVLVWGFGDALSTL